MQVVLETTQWSDLKTQPNHIYLMEGNRALAYIPWGRGEPFYFKRGILIDRRGRKFVELDQNPFGIKNDPDTVIKVKGSKGDTYFIDRMAKTCSCPGFAFRNNCKHIKDLSTNKEQS